LYRPKWANEKRDSGVDLRFPTDVTFPEGRTTVVDLGVRAACLGRNSEPTGFWLATRSSFTKTSPVLMLRNFMGVIDAGYRGSLKASVHNFGPGSLTVPRGVSFFQILEPMMRPPMSMTVCKNHPYFADGATIRGDGGFGSTGNAGQASGGP
jgi:dUTPase